MASTALAVRSKSSALTVIDPKNLNYDVAREWAAKEAAGRRAFQGEQVKFNGQDGEWKLGFGDNAKILKDGHQIVGNYPHTTIAWQEWAGDAPNYPYIEMVFAGGSLPPRSELGHTDKEEWKPNKFKKGEKVDPVKKVTVLFGRDLKGTKTLHILADNISASIAIARFIEQCIDEGKRKPGMLPVIALSAEKVKKEGKSFYAPVIEIMDWVKSIAMDCPEQGMLEAVAAVEDDDDQGEVKSSSRKAKKPARDEDEDDADDEDDDDHDPRRGNKGRDIAKSYEEVEAEEEDEAPKPKRRASSRNDDEDEDDEAPRTRRRPSNDDDESEGETRRARRR